MPTNNSFYESIQIATMGLDEVKKSLAEVQQLALQTSQKVRETMDASRGVGGTPSGASENIKKTTSAVNEFGQVVVQTNTKIQAMVELNKQRVEAMEQANASTSRGKKMVNEFGQVTVQTNKHIQASIALEQQKSATLDKAAKDEEKLIKNTEKLRSKQYSTNIREANSFASNMKALDAQREKALNKIAKADADAQKQKTQQYKTNIKEANSFASNMKSIDAQRERSIKQIAREKAELKKQSDTYVRMNKHFQFLKQTYRDLAIKKQLGIKLTANEEARMLALKDKILVLDKAYKQVDGSMGIYNRSVGQYGKAFDSLGFSVAQITREAPAFLNSVQTGFMAISNNIPIFVDELEKLKIKNAQLIKDQKDAIPIWKSLGKAFFSYQTAISGFILLITFVGPKIFKFIQKITQTKEVTDGATASLKAFNKTLREGVADIQSDIMQLQLLSKATTDVSLSTEDRMSAVKQLKDLYPEYLQGMTDEQILANGIGDAYGTLTKEIERMGKMKAVANRLSEIAGDMLEQELLAEESLIKQKAARMIIDAGIGASWFEIKFKQLMLLGDEADAQVKGADAQSELNKLKKEEARIIAFVNDNLADYINLQTQANEKEEEKKNIIPFTVEHYRSLISANKKIIETQLTQENSGFRDHLLALNKGYEEQIKLLLGVGDTENEYAKGSIGWLQKKISLNDELITQSGDRAFINKTQEENKELQKQIDLLMEGKAIQKPIQAEPINDGIIGNLERQIAIIDKLQKATNFQDEINRLQNVKEALQENLEVVKAGGQARVDYQDQINAEMQEYLNNLDIEAKREKEKEIGEKKWMDEKIKKLQLINDFIQQGADLGIAIIERNVVALEKEMDAVQEKYDEDVRIAEKTLVDDEELANKKEALQEEKEIKEKEIEKKIAKEKKKQFLVNQAAALAEIAINTAIWVTNAGAQTGLFGLTLAPFIIAFGALQAATVLAQPVPAYAQGTEWHPGGPAVLGDGGKHEAAILPTGQIWKSPNKDTLVNLPVGTRVEPDFDKYVEGENKKVYDSRLLRTIAFQQIQQKRDKELLMAINRQTDVLKKKNLAVSVKGSNDINHQLWRMKQINWS